MSYITVAVRLRPRASGVGLADAAKVLHVSQGTVVVNPKFEDLKAFGFDFVYSADPQSIEYGSQERIYREMGGEILRYALDGYNGCLFAYGQTGSGKTHTMLGSESEMGIIPRLCADLFHRSDRVKVWISYLEIYNEKVRDLISSNTAGFEQQNLSVFEHQGLGVVVPDARVETVSSYAELKRLLDLGTSRRSTASTASNNRSSRSHAIFTLHIETEKCVSKINLIDLAGSERSSKNSLSPPSVETNMINQSLTTLGIVIKALSEKNEFIPFRNSKLTFLLKDSLSGNSRTFMIATVSGDPCDIEETISTLRFASFAKKIITIPKKNFGTQADMIKTLQEEIVLLRSQLLQSPRTRAAAGRRTDPQFEAKMRNAKLEIEKQFKRSEFKRNFSGTYLRVECPSRLDWDPQSYPILASNPLQIGGTNEDNAVLLEGINFQIGRIEVQQSGKLVLILENAEIFTKQSSSPPVRIRVNGGEIGGYPSLTRVFLGDNIQLGDEYFLRLQTTIPKAVMDNFKSLSDQCPSYRALHSDLMSVALPRMSMEAMEDLFEETRKLFCQEILIETENLGIIIPSKCSDDEVHPKLIVLNDSPPGGSNMKLRLENVLSQIDGIKGMHADLQRLRSH